MKTTLDLLNSPTNEMTREIVSQVIAPGIDMNNLIIGLPMSYVGRDLAIPVSVNNAALDDPEWPYRGEVSVEYDRMDLTNFFVHSGVDLEFRLPEISSTEDIAKLIRDIFLVRMDTIDFVFAPIYPKVAWQTVMFHASQGSSRWKGSVAVRVQLRQEIA